MSELPFDLNKTITSMYGEVGAYFTITEIPAGGAPLVIKEQWVGLTLPVRIANVGRQALGYEVRVYDIITKQVRENNEPVPVTGLEALHVLDSAGKQEAVDFWLPYGLALFTFRAHEGLLAPVVEK